MAGMTGAAIVTGNTVVLKPSSDAPTIAARFLDVLEEAGMPPGVVNFCPGRARLWKTLSSSIRRRASSPLQAPKRTGLEIHERAAQTQPGQLWIKRTILEMGGKDSIVVSADCDLDAAVEGVVASAFGFSGQKCSACSRAIVEDSIYEPSSKASQSVVEDLRVGDPLQNRDLGPVINEAARKNILSTSKSARGKGAC